MKIGDPLDDVIVRFSDGATRALSEHWATAPTVLVFLRHFG